MVKGKWVLGAAFIIKSNKRGRGKSKVKGFEVQMRFEKSIKINLNKNAHTEENAVRHTNLLYTQQHTESRIAK